MNILFIHIHIYILKRIENVKVVCSQGNFSIKQKSRIKATALVLTPNF